jgi:Holliday junction resolvase RusA-like endonuclease
MMELYFSIPGQPVAKGRPKFARRGNFVTAYTPAKTVNYEGLVKMASHHAMAGREPSAAPIEMEVCLYLQIPASWSKKKRAAAVSGNVMATKKPDADNVLKGLKDGCNGIVWRDDAQVVSIILQKKYSEMPMACVIVRELAGECA